MECANGMRTDKRYRSCLALHLRFSVSVRAACTILFVINRTPSMSAHEFACRRRATTDQVEWQMLRESVFGFSCNGDEPWERDGIQSSERPSQRAG